VNMASEGVDPSPAVVTYQGEQPKMNEAFKDGTKSKEVEETNIPYNDAAPVYEYEEGRAGKEGAVETNEDLVTRVIHVEDDPTLNPWTFRVFFLGTYTDTQMTGLTELSPRTQAFRKITC